MESRIMEWQRLGTVAYREAWALQERLRERRERGELADRMLLLEHPPVITLGKRACEGDVIAAPEALGAEGIELVATNRGGRATYHGPGQIVGYFVCSLESMGLGVQDFVRAIEELCLGALREAGVVAARDPAHPGLWVGREKIVAIGLHVARGITQHGFALNVEVDLAAYRHIVACGIVGRGVTSMAKLLPAAPSMASMQERLAAHAGRVFKRSMVEVEAALT